MTRLLVRNGRIWTGNPGIPWADCAVVDEGRFVFVGREQDASVPSDAEVLDARGNLVLPGFVDSHQHVLMTGFWMRQVDLKGVGSVEEVQRRVAERVASTPRGSWVEGSGWDQNDWPEKRFPTRQMLDSVAPDNPVVLTHTSGHAVWVNSAALRAAGIDASTEAPAGGAIDREPDGTPTGVLRDNATEAIDEAIPEPTDNERRNALDAGLRQANRHGLTGAHAMHVGGRELDAMQAAESEGALTLRLRAFLSARNLERWEGLRTGDGSDLLRVGGVKFFADGALGSLTAWMEEPYEGTDDLGFPLEPIEELERRVRWCLERGLAPAIHAIGDRANREVLDILERASGISPELTRRIEHAQLLEPGLAERFAKLGVTASVQPIHATQDMEKVDRHWGSRSEHAYPFASLLAAGVNLAFGSDSPVETLDPLAGLRAAVTRQRADGTPSGGWHPGERLTVEQAIGCYTSGPAVALSEEDRWGRIQPGCFGDMVIVSANFLEAASVGHLVASEVLATVVGGRVVYRAAEFA